MIARVSDSRAAVLVSGESGTGKELVARALFTTMDRVHRAVCRRELRQRLPRRPCSSRNCLGMSAFIHRRYWEQKSGSEKQAKAPFFSTKYETSAVAQLCLLVSLAGA